MLFEYLLYNCFFTDEQIFLLLMVPTVVFTTSAVVGLVRVVLHCLKVRKARKKANKKVNDRFDTIESNKYFLPFNNVAVTTHHDITFAPPPALPPHPIQQVIADEVAPSCDIMESCLVEDDDDDDVFPLLSFRREEDENDDDNDETLSLTYSRASDYVSSDEEDYERLSEYDDYDNYYYADVPSASSSFDDSDSSDDDMAPTPAEEEPITPPTPPVPEVPPPPLRRSSRSRKKPVLFSQEYEMYYG